MKVRKILALDLGTETGWAINTSSQTNGLIGLGFDCGHRTFDGEISGWRYLAFKRWLDVEIDRLEIEHIVYEETFSLGAYAARILHGFLAILQLVYAEHYPTDFRFTMSKVHPNKLKKFATGNGHAKKPQMMNVCYAKFGYMPADDNECDSIFLLEYQLDRDRNLG